MKHIPATPTLHGYDMRNIIKEIKQKPTAEAQTLNKFASKIIAKISADDIRQRAKEKFDSMTAEELIQFLKQYDENLTVEESAEHGGVIEY
jgi:hypothetical protein